LSFKNIKPDAAFNSLFLFSVQHFSWEAQDKNLCGAWTIAPHWLWTHNLSREVTHSLPYLNFGLTGIQTLGPTFVTAREVATLTPGGPWGVFQRRRIEPCRKWDIEAGAVSLTRNMNWRGERAWNVNAGGQGIIGYSLEHALVDLVRICQNFHCLFWQHCNVTRYLKRENIFPLLKSSFAFSVIKVPTQVPKGYHQKIPFKKEHAARLLEFLGKLFHFCKALLTFLV